MNSTVWVTGHSVGAGWSILGVFTSEEKAIAACTKQTHFIGPMTLDEVVDGEDIDWIGAYYPLVQSKQ